MRSFKLRVHATLVLLCFYVAGQTATAGEVVVAHVGPFSGPLAVNGLANLEGTKACISEANADGGINGNTLRLVQRDDEYKPEKTIAVMRDVAASEKPVAFLNLLGSANVAALIKDSTLESLKVPVVGVTPGADVLRSPGSPWMFHTHASDNAQLARIVQHLSMIGIKRIAVVYQDIPFGRGGLEFIQGVAQKASVTITKNVAVPSAGEDFIAIISDLRQSNAQAYVMILVPNSGAAFAAQIRDAGDATPVYGMSYVPVQGVVDKAGNAAAAGIGLAQVTPNTDSTSSALIRRFRAAMEHHAPKDTARTQLHLIGYLNCRVLVEGLRQTDRAPTPEGLRRALQKLRVDLGGYTVDFAGGNVGSRYVDIGVVTRGGRLQY
ncbi:ABC transporter substrate-binding protein [Acidovorax sp. FHTAMBA]|jgi:ABC-type branched-subunit amino acid transport system substrate-binding protein|uniref:ABC transporter substrate-binding protein n=1 Tax=Acidovorax sp. FHTAMBA TaxID=3140252 RepID=UPI0015F6BEDC